MKRRLIPLMLALLSGCATRSVMVGPSTKSIREVSAEEFRIIEVARQAVTAREGANGRSWADRATYDIRRQTNGWSVMVLKTRRDLFGRPDGYPACGGDRRITIDEQGKVTEYH